MLVAEILCEFVYVIFVIECHERLSNVRIGYVTLAEGLAEIARVEVYDLLDDTIAVSILKLGSCLEKIKPGVRKSHISHKFSKI